MKPRPAIAALAAGVVLFGLSACDDEPLRISGLPPVIEDFRPVDSLLTANVGEVLTFSVEAADPDGDRLRHYFAVDGVIVSRDHTWRFVVTDTGVVRVSYVASDGDHEARVDWSLARHHVNRPPSIQSYLPLQSTLDMDVGDAIEFSVDTVDPDGDVLEHFFRIDGVLASTEPGVVFTATRAGRIAVEAFAWDGELVVTHRWMVNVAGPEVNRPPVIYLRLPVSSALDARLGTDIELSIHASDPDGDALAYLFQVDGVEAATTSRFVFPATEPGTFVVTASVSDGDLSSATEWTINVTSNHAPELVNLSPSGESLQVSEGTRIVFSADAVDPDGDPLTYSFRLDGAMASSGKSFAFQAGAAGTYEVMLEATDGEFVASHTWEVTVVEVPVNHPPAFSAYSPGAVDLLAYAGDAVTFLVEASDPDGDPIEVSYHVDGLRVWTGLAFTYTGDLGDHVVEARVTDGELGASHTWRLTLVDRAVAWLHGRLRDALTTEVLPGVSVEIGLRATSTDALGQFEFEGLPPYGGTLVVRDEMEEGVFGDYFDYTHAYSMADGNFLEIFLLPNMAVVSPYYSDFHQFFRSMTDTPGIPASTAQRRWDLPIDVSVPALVVNGLDYRATIVDVLTEFDAILGTQVFRVVGAPPAVGVNVVFPGAVYADNYRVDEWSDDYYPLRGRIQFRSVYAAGTVEPFKVIIRHEFGHALGLGHSVDIHHLMVGAQTPAVSHFSSDELNVLRVRYTIPRGHEMLDHLRD